MPKPPDQSPFVIVMKGKKAILRHEPLLKQLAERSGQPGAMHWLSFFLSGRGALWKRPYVVLVLNRHASLEDLRLEDVDGAVLLFELILLGFGTRAFATDDWEATRTVIASRNIRPMVVAHAINFLMRRGAQIVLISYDGPPMPVQETCQILQEQDILWAEHTRELKKGFTLSPSLDLTLARLGKATRFNLRYYRRRLNLQTEVEFLDDAMEAVTRADMIGLNKRSLYPVSIAECDRRLRVLREPDSFLIGLREKGKGWLSLLGGWRQANTTVMHFQFNTASRPRDSIGTVMRSYFLESEIARNTKHLAIYHGTSHPMASAFAVASIRDVIVRRKTLHSYLLHKLAEQVDSHPYEAGPEDFQGSTTFLASVLTSANSVWHTTVRAPEQK